MQSLWDNCLAQFLKAGAIPVGAGEPANTGEAGAIYLVGFFAGMPAPTGFMQPSSLVQYLWERL
ncbi:hypothetical protein D3C81_475970 [compost metagenome]